MNPFKELLTLAYFNSVQASYSYQEICNIFGYTNEQVDNLIEKLCNEGYLELKGYYKLSQKGLELLQKNGFENIDIFNEPKEESIFVNKPMEKCNIYIPEGFTKKYK